MPTRPSATTWALLLFLAAIWGASFMAVAVALEGFGPLQIAAIRVGGAAVILTIYAWASGRSAPGEPGSAKIWIFVLAFAFLSNAIPFTLLGWGMQRVASGFAGITMTTVPLLMLPLAHFLVPGERLSVRRALGFLVGFAGTLVLVGPDAFQRAGGDYEGLARLACVAAAASYACGGIVIKLAPVKSMISFSAAALSVATIIIAPIALAVEGLPEVNSARALLAMIYLAVLPTALATLIMMHIIRTAGPTFFTLVNYQVPIWSVIFGALVLDEVLPASLFVALAMIFLGLAIAQSARRG